MEGPLAVPFHFAVEFLVLVVALGGALDALRARRHGAGVWCLGQAAGFFALALAQGAHGSLAAQADGGTELLALRALAFGLLAFSRPGHHVATAGAVTPALFFPGDQASLAVVPALLALVAAVPGVRAHRRDQDPATFAYTAAFVCFAAAEFATATSPRSGGAWMLGAHIARAFAALLLARWLYASVARSLRLRFVAAFVAVLTVGILVVSAALNVVISHTLQAEELKRLTDAATTRTASIAQTAETAASNTSVFVGTKARPTGIGEDMLGPDPRAAIACAPGRGSRSLDGFAAQALEILPPDADFLIFVRVGQRTVGSAGARPKGPPCVLARDEEIAISGSSVVRDALRGRGSSSPVSIRVNRSDGTIETQVVAMGADPIRRNGDVVGAVAIGYRVDEGFLARMKQETRADATLLVGDGTIASSTVADRAAVGAAIATVRGDLRRAREGRVPLERIITIGGNQHSVSFVPLTSGGRPIGVLMLSTLTEALATAQRQVTGTLFLITLLAVLLAAVLAWMTGGRVTRPVRALTSAVIELREGNLEARARVTNDDEVGTLGSAFNRMAEELQRTTSDLVDAAGTEATLRARMEAILQSMGDALLATDEHGHVATVNRAAERLLGVRSDRVVGHKLTEVLRGTTPGGRSLQEAALRGGATEGTLHAGGRKKVPVALTSAPLQDAHGSTIGRVVLLRDVSRMHEAERMKSEFLQNVSHELRTPITPIKGFAEIMRRREFPREKTEQFLEGILQSTERLERIVEILVDFAAIEAGRLKPQSEPIPVRSMIEDIATRWRDRLKFHKVVCRGGQGVPAILGDAKLLGRSFDELIDNAVKFSPDGGTIEISAAPYLNGASRARKVQVTIRDSGIGIAPEAMADLFQDFRQLDGSETRAYGGLGLGLAYVKRIASVHGGEILVESEPGKGSAFTMVLPASGRVIDAAPHPSARAPKPEPPKAAPRKPAKAAAKPARTPGRRGR